MTVNYVRVELEIHRRRSATRAVTDQAAINFYLHISSPEENDPSVAAHWANRRRVVARLASAALKDAPQRPTLVGRRLHDRLNGGEVVTVDAGAGAPGLTAALEQLGGIRDRHVHADLAEPLPLKDASAAVVISTEVVEHLLDPVALLREAFRILKPGGHLVLTTPNQPTFPGMILHRRATVNPNERIQGGVTQYGHVSILGRRGGNASSSSSASSSSAMATTARSRTPRRQTCSPTARLHTCQVRRLGCRVGAADACP